jgi:hypothetical protein
MEASEARAHHLFDLASKLYISSDHPRSLYINPNGTNSQNRATIIDKLTSLEADTARISSWCRSHQTMHAQKKALVNFAYVVKAWEMLAPCKRRAHSANISTCTNVPNDISMILNLVFLSVVSGVEFLQSDGLFEVDTMDASTLFGAALSGSQTRYQTRDNAMGRNRRVGHAMLTTLIRLDSHLPVRSQDGVQRAAALLAQLDIPDALQETPLTGWVSAGTTRSPTPPPTPYPRHIVPVNANQCSHVQCGMRYHGDHAVMTVNHHHLEQHGSNHYCAINRGSGKCVCKCHGGDTSPLEEVPEMEPWFKAPGADQEAPPAQQTPDQVMREACAESPTYDQTCDEQWTQEQWQTDWAETAYCSWHPDRCTPHADIHETECNNNPIVQGCEVYWNPFQWKQHWSTYCQWHPNDASCQDHADALADEATAPAAEALV